MWCRAHRMRADRGFTLVELMIAVAVSTLVVAAALSVFLTLTAAQKRQQDSRQAEGRQALDVLRRDMACALPTAITDAPPFRLDTPSRDPGAGVGSDLALTTAQYENGPADPAHLQVWRVRYRLVPQGEADESTLALSREAVRLESAGGSGSVATTLLFRSAAGFEVAVPDRTGWTNRWSFSSRQPLPPLARAQLSWAQAGTTAVAVSSAVIPAALKFPAPTRARPAGAPPPPTP